MGAEVTSKPNDGSQHCTPQEVPNFEHMPRSRVCFHGFTLGLDRLEVLIERIHQFIEPPDVVLYPRPRSHSNRT